MGEVEPVSRCTVRRVTAPQRPTDYWLPKFDPQRGGRRGLFIGAEFESEVGPVVSSCLACLDTPCRRFSDSEVEAAVMVDTPVALDTSVCPAEAINLLGSSGVPVIDGELCLGCGLCITRCPVGAIHLDASDGVAVVASPDPTYYEVASKTPDEFVDERARLASLLQIESAPFADAGLVTTQIGRLEQRLLPGEEERAFRLLARNVFLSLGYAARLSNRGDNAAFAELVVGDQDALLLLEVEPHSDTLDAFRRAIAGAAIAISRYGVDRTDIGVAVVMTRLPNSRVDYYELVKDAATRIGIGVRALPLALLLLGLRSADARLWEFLLTGPVADIDHKTLEADVTQFWGAVEGAGLVPAK